MSSASKRFPGRIAVAAIVAAGAAVAASSFADDRGEPAAKAKPVATATASVKPVSGRTERAVVNLTFGRGGGNRIIAILIGLKADQPMRLGVSRLSCAEARAEVVPKFWFKALPDGTLEPDVNGTAYVNSALDDYALTSRRPADPYESVIILGGTGSDKFAAACGPLRIFAPGEILWTI